MTKRLIPDPHMGLGSYGGGVIWLQDMLSFAGFLKPGDATKGLYDEVTKMAVMGLQVTLGFTGADVDGRFGPNTRRALAEQRGVAVDKVTLEEYGRTTVCKDPG